MIAYISLAFSMFFVFLDQLFKSLIVTHLPKNQSVPIIENIIHFSYVENTGAAFGIFDKQRWILVGITSIVLIICIILIITKKVKNNFAVISLSLIIAGGIGNLIDRVNLKYVIDYIEFRFFPGFAIFNFADCLVVIGTIMLGIYIFFFEGKEINKQVDNSQITIDQVIIASKTEGENND